MSRLNKKQFELNPNLFLEKAIREFVATGPKNRLPAFNNEPIFAAPLVGFADGDDPIFEYYRAVVDASHLTPREVWARQGQNIGGNLAQPEKLSVISFVLPITKETCRSMYDMNSLLPSLRWNHTRWQGQELINELSNYVASLLKELGYPAVVPELAPFFEVKYASTGERVSNWSQRHIAYAAGLGTFSLNDGFISPRGMALRCGSVLTNTPLLPRPRIYQNHLVNCLFYRNGSCIACIKRCPVGAISKEGHDRKKCREFIMERQPAILRESGKEGYLGRYLGCGFCQTKVPCEARIPLSA